MVSLVYSIVSVLKSPILKVIACPCRNRCSKVKHQVLTEDFISRFEEIFVIGDVHGCKDELDELYNDAGLANDSCLKIFVGDLINKGPYNMEVLRFLRQSQSILSVRGNHEEVVLDNYYADQENVVEKNKWIKNMSEDDVKFLEELPYTISIPSLKVIIVHAGLIPGIPLEQNKPEDMVSMRNLIINDYFSYGGIQASKRDTNGEAWASLWPGPEHVYFGHDAKRKLQLEAFATGLDTGCLYGGSLTGVYIAGPRKGTFVDIKAKKTYVTPKKLQKTKCTEKKD